VGAAKSQGLVAARIEKGGIIAVLKSVSVILLALVVSFVGGVAGGAVPHSVIKSRNFVLVDASGRRRAVLAIVPDPSCPSCDGNARLIVFDPRNPQQPQVWPPTRGVPNPQQAMELLKLLKMAAPLL